MSKLKFKTNINCGGCVATVTPFLNSEKTVEHWEVDTNNPSKILTVEGESLDKNAVITKVTAAGFKIEEI